MMSERHRNASLIAKTAPEHLRRLASQLETETTFTERNAMGIAPTGGMALQPEMASQVASFSLLSSLVMWVCNPSGGLEVDGSQHLG